MKTTINGHTLSYEEKGSGKTSLLFIHGGGCSALQWKPQTQEFSKHFHTLAIDLPGHGNSKAAPQATFHYSEWVDLLLQFIQEKKLSSIVLIGHSLGASICLALGAKLGSQLSRIILVDPTIDVSRAPKEALDPFLDALATDQEMALTQNAESYLVHATEETKALVLSDIKRTQPGAVCKSIQSLVHFDPRIAFDNVQASTHCLICSLNNFPYSLHKVIGTLDAIVVSEANHWFHLDKADTVNAHLLEFLELPPNSP